MADSKICSIEGCGKRAASRGWCQAHYLRWRKHGDPLAGRQTPNGEPERFLREEVLPHTGDDCLIWPYARGGRGYGQLNRKGAKLYVHRLACENIHGPAPSPDHEVAHSCGNGHKGCVNPRHLRWKTRAENHADKLIHGTDRRGEKCPTGKLTTEQVLEIRALHGTMSHVAIAARYKVARQSIDDIISRVNWFWLP